MRRAYHVLAYLIAVEVVVQAMMIATGVAGLGHWIDDGATVNKHILDNNPSFTGSWGFAVHAINGEMLIPLLAIILLIVSFFAKVAGGTRWAALRPRVDRRPGRAGRVAGRRAVSRSAAWTQRVRDPRRRRSDRASGQDAGGGRRRRDGRSSLRLARQLSGACRSRNA